MKAADTCIKKEDKKFLEDDYSLAQAMRIIYLTGEGKVFKDLASSKTMSYFYYRVTFFFQNEINFYSPHSIASSQKT